MPLCEEGSWLRLGKIVQGPMGGPIGVTLTYTLKEELIHIPLGSGVILPVDQLHAGHYGKENNIRYHAILVDEGWDGS